DRPSAYRRRHRLCCQPDRRVLSAARNFAEGLSATPCESKDHFREVAKLAPDAQRDHPPPNALARSERGARKDEGLEGSGSGLARKPSTAEPHLPGPTYAAGP